MVNQVSFFDAVYKNNSEQQSEANIQYIYAMLFF